MQDGPASDPDPTGTSRRRSLGHLVDELLLPDPGSGGTAERFSVLTAVSAGSLSLGRLLEGHADSRSILCELGADVPPGPLAIWASESPGRERVTVIDHHAAPVISGVKRFCSGATVVRSALVTARTEAGEEVLVLVDVDSPGVTVWDADWAGLGMRGADTRTVGFDRAPVRERIGPPRWYLERPGFWHGAVGVAACWLGGAVGLAQTLRSAVGDDAHALAHLGAVEAELYAMQATLTVAAREIDADPLDVPGAHRRALSVRAVVERGCRSVIEQVTAGLGPRALAFDRDHSQRVADLQVYLGQHHGRRDLEDLGRLTSGKEGTQTC